MTRHAFAAIAIAMIFGAGSGTDGAKPPNPGGTAATQGGAPSGDPSKAIARVDGEIQRQDDFTVIVTFAGWLTGSVAGMEHPLPIPSLGDEAYFVGGKSGPPYARVSDIAVGIENFPDTRESKSGVDLLRLAVPRARATQ